MTNPVLQAISERRSNRGYSKKQLTEEQLQTILQAAMEAPSARNTQPWHFSVVQDRGLLDAFNADYKALGNHPEAYHLFFHAPTVVFISTPIEAPSKFSLVDCGIAVQNMALAAHSIGLGSVILGRPLDVFLSPKGDYYQKAFKFPEGFKFAIAISLGEPTLSKDAHPIHEGLISRV